MRREQRKEMWALVLDALQHKCVFATLMLQRKCGVATAQVWKGRG